MPITKSAIKAAKQAKKREARNKSLKTKMKTFIKKVLVLSKDNVDEAKKVLPKAYSVIDTASKKNIIHPNNAARKKSQLAKAVDSASPKK